MWRVCRVMRDRSLETVRALRGVAIVRVFVVSACSFAWFVSFPCCFVPFWRVSCSVCVIACAAGMRARNESARESCRARSFRVKRRARRVTSRP